MSLERVALLRELQEASARCAETRRMLLALGSDASPDYREHRTRVHRIAKKRARAAFRAWTSYRAWEKTADPADHFARARARAREKST